MDWQMLGAIGESVGALGVIISLAYLAIQVRSGARATRRQFAHEFKSSWRWAAFSDPISRPEVVSLPGFAKWWADRGHWFTPEFREVVEKEMREGVQRVASFYSKAVAEADEK